jgi:excisionase family DNA binding protein
LYSLRIMGTSQQKIPPDFSVWPTKAEAAQIIGCSTKTIESLAQSGKLQQSSRRRVETGALIAVYHPGDVERIRRERNPEAVTPFVVTASQNHSETSREAAVARPQPQQGEILQALLAALSANSQRLPEPAVRTSEKLFLSISEAADFSGLPRSYVREQMRAGKLPAIKTGAGWRIRRADLSAL